MSDPKIKRVTLERMLGLPIGYLADEKNLAQPETKTLLKMIEHLPFLAYVADCGFDPVKSKEYLVHAAIEMGLFDKKD